MEPQVLSTAIKKQALHNAILHKGKAAPNAVVSKLIGEHPELKLEARQISGLAAGIIADVNAMTLGEQRQLLQQMAPDLQRKPVKAQHKKMYLPELPHHERVAVRFAPNPNGPATLGSARGIVVNSEYAKRYGGSFILRFDDTDPQTKRPMLEAYDWYLEDCKWLGTTPDVVVNASDRMEIYYHYAEELIAQGAAYVCTCSQPQFKKLKDAGLACPDRENAAEKNMRLWEQMLDGRLGEKKAVLRIKTDVTHKNPALRDWIGFRIVDTTHPRGLAFRVWPMLDFESAIEDHELGVTHIIRGKDLRDSERRQEFLYNYMGWVYPFTLHWGRISIHEFGKFSTSKLRSEIAKGLYSGWDDPRLPTLMALRRRGFSPEAVRLFILKLGINESDISVSLENLYAENRKLVDPVAHRYFFVSDPITMSIRNAKPTTARAPLHPSSSASFREIPVDGGVCVSAQDLTLSGSDLVRLKDLYNVRIVKKEPLEAEYAGDEIIKGTRIIHWAPPSGPQVQVFTPSGVDIGIGEPGIAAELDRVVQFERYGFARVDQVLEQHGQTKIICYFTHK
ncbi:MAG: glutamate--tRNA ligase [Halobacteriota archaeon]